MANKNIACRIFKEQIDLVLALPETDRAEVLYKAIISVFNHFDYQIENQNDIQIENAYVSVSDSVSIIGKKVFNLLEKSIVCKEFSNNYGGSRKGAGAPKGNTNAKKNNQIDYQNDIQIDNQTDCKKIDFDTTFKAGGQLWTLPPNFRKLALTRYTESEIRAFEITHSCHESLEDVCLNDIKHEQKPKTTRFVKPTVEEIETYCKERNNNVDAHKFYNHYESNGWKVGKNPMKDWKAAVRTWEKNNFEQPKKEKINFSFYTGEGSFLKPDGEW